jgi:nucleotide-binding universal stress UspA family protein
MMRREGRNTGRPAQVDVQRDIEERTARLALTGLIVCADGGPGCRPALDWAVFIGRLTGCEVHAVSVGPAPGGESAARFLGSETADDPESKVTAAVAHLRAAGVRASGHAAQGDPGWGILGVAKQTGAQLVILGAHNHGQGLRPGLGGVAAFILASAEADVLVARASPPPGTILAGTDGSPAAERAVAIALAFAKGLGARPAVVQAYPKLDSHGAAGTALAKRKDLGRDVERRVRIGDPVRTLLDEVARGSTDLLVLGNRGYGGLSMTSLGSVSDQVALRAEGSVLIVKPPPRAAAGAR